MVKPVKRIFLSPPHLGEWEQAYAMEAFDTNWISSVGPHVDAFEREIAEYAGVREAVVLSSGTAALHLALKALGIKPGDTVFVSALTFVASVNPIVYEGAVPVFIDSERATWNMSPRALERAMDDAVVRHKLPKAIIVVNLYGQSANMDELKAIADAYGVPIVEDSAESLGATYRGKASGTLGAIGFYSFNGNKIITTSGGGAMVAKDPEILRKVKYWSTQAKVPARHYEHEEVGYNYRMSNVLAGIGRGQLKVLEERVAARRRVFDAYYRELSGIDGISFMPESPDGLSTRWLTALTLDPEIIPVKPTELMDELEQAQIESRPVWKPMQLQPLYRRSMYYAEEGGSVSDELYARGVCLPSGSSLTEEDLERVIGGIKRVLRRESISC